MRIQIQLILLALVVCGAGKAQDDSRLAEIAAEQERKAADLKPDQPGRAESVFLSVKKHSWVERIIGAPDGFMPTFGGLAPGTGFGIGARYKRSDLAGGAAQFRAGATTSLRGDRKFALELTAPRLADGKVFTTLYAVRHDYSRMSYYGPGPDSLKTGRTDFRLEDTAIDGTIGLRPLRRLTVGATAGYLWNNVGPGGDSRYANTEATYTPQQAPGIDHQSNFVRTGAFAGYDWRDNPDGARRGGYYLAQFSDYHNRTFGGSDFRRVDLEAQHYVSLLNQRRVFALRGRSTFTYADAPIPFYMQPSLGGSDDLRGYRPYRFHGDNLLVVNAEYRWEVFSGLDMAIFADAGKVFDRKADFNVRNLESDVGFGFRFNERNRTFLRLDLAFSHEGFQIWIKFNNVFTKRPALTSSSLGDF